LHDQACIHSTNTLTNTIYTLSLHDALPILDQQKLSENEASVQDKKQVASAKEVTQSVVDETQFAGKTDAEGDQNLRQMRVEQETDRKSTRLNSSHVKISYAVFCLKKKNKQK